MKSMLKMIWVLLLVFGMTVSAHAMGSTPEVPNDEASQEDTQLGVDMMSFALNMFTSSMSEGIDMQTLLKSFTGLGQTGFITLGEHNGTTVSMAPTFSGLAGLTFRLEFDNAVVDVPADPSKIMSEENKKQVGTIKSGILDITAGVDLFNMNFTMITLKLDTPETLILDDGADTELVFDDVKCGFDVMNGDIASPDAFAVSGVIYVNDFAIDMEQVSDLIAIMSQLIGS